jgi:hypothetical protein
MDSRLKSEFSFLLSIFPSGENIRRVRYMPTVFRLARTSIVKHPVRMFADVLVFTSELLHSHLCYHSFHKNVLCCFILSESRECVNNVSNTFRACVKAVQKMAVYKIK